ncbi:Similar to Karyogamy protein KAR9; acc. no. P32526 [Pyronema omphalodes CBS 100304]|uniref:Similar to Karyogamy protein KAR9 acc. no. P32526 n=1 Tax=Pyronema omphalodes (strain CBS 100304) TaxID=1076935 RepID=U4LWR7_PYROM|nr:Similar to Karyogamy protein KAR9; acc. no. P32526 [Pyronema omphalodes CBS 100304]
MCTALVSAGSQISRWISTAQKVLTGLDSEDDIEWAAQGKEALTEVDTAVKKFSGLMNVYIELIDELQSRPDSDSVDSSVFLEIVGAMEETVDGWKEVQEQLKGVKEQVEIALEWQELWKMVLKDIQTEIEGCQTALFELEEKRHMEGADIEALETIMEDGGSKTEMEDGALLGLVARMQPLRASLDFLPMRISSFTTRAEDVFPTACEELESRRNQLEKKWKRLNNDAENLKKELGEDRWVAIFRNAGKQATQMLESIERSMERLRTAVIEWEDGRTERDMRELQKAMEGYEAKKMHYGSAIQRTFSIITRGISDRYTINGEIIRLSTVLATRWKALDAESAILDQVLRDLQIDAQALRDSISSLNSLDILSPGLASPGTSPASSVQLNSPLLKPVDYSNRSNTSDRGKSPRRRPPSIIGTSPNIQKRQSRTITPTQSPIRTFSAPSTTSTTSSGTSSNAYSPDPRKPRWNASVKPDSDNTGHNFKPLSLTTPSPYRKVTPPSTRRNSSSLGSRIPMPSPLGKDKQPPGTQGQPMFSPIKSPQMGPMNATRYRSGSNASVQNGYLASPTPQRTLRHQVSASRLRNKDGTSASGLGSAGLNGNMSASMGAYPQERENVRPQSAMAHMHSASGRRSSMMYRPTTPGGGQPQSRTGSRQSVYGAPGGDGKPRWRY